MQAHDLLTPTAAGLYCPLGDFYIDPVRPVSRALITHGHSDHARPGHEAVLATAETLAVMAIRYGTDFAQSRQPIAYGDPLAIDGVSVSFHPAGHVLGSAQIAVTAGNGRIVVSGDYKRQPDPTCHPFELVPADVFVTEATFGLPVFRHPPPENEIAKLLASLTRFPERCHLVGAYALGKAQRVIRLLRLAGYGEPIFIHGSLERLCAFYESNGVPLGPLLPATTDRAGDAFAGRIVIGPPSAFADRWARRFPDPVHIFASGWMLIRQRARQRGVELPLVLSDHADWDELTATCVDTGAAEVWVTHGREEALVRWLGLRGIAARPLNMVGYEDENE